MPLKQKWKAPKKPKKSLWKSSVSRNEEVDSDEERTLDTGMSLKNDEALALALQLLQSWDSIENMLLLLQLWYSETSACCYSGETQLIHAAVMAVLKLWKADLRLYVTLFPGLFHRLFCSGSASDVHLVHSAVSVSSFLLLANYERYCILFQAVISKKAQTNMKTECLRPLRFVARSCPSTFFRTKTHLWK